MISRKGAIGSLSVLGILFLAAAAAIWLSGGVQTEVFGIRVRARNPMRPMWIGVGLLLVRTLFGRRAGFDAEDQLLRTLTRPAVLATTLAVLVTCVALVTNYGVGGGADSYGYVSQAELWLAGDLTVEQEWIRGAPWPHAILTATPLAYRPAISGLATVPVYAPGLPLLLAGGKFVFGQCGIVVVSATMAGLLVAATFWIGQRVASPQVGAAAAWLMATSPVMLFMMASPMSDVPAAALTALALFCCLYRTPLAALTCGFLMAAVILIRPNLAPIAGVFGLWLLASGGVATGWSGRILRAALFSVAAATGIGVMAAVNASLYGSATASGYGDLEGFFATSHIIPNIRNYSAWLLESQTPIAAIGLLALVVPARWVGKAQRPSDAGLLVLVAAGVLAIYLPYLVFDRWWYLRFLLPVFPVMAIGTAWLLTNRSGTTLGPAGIAVLLAIGGWGLHFARTHDAFVVGWFDLRYVSAAHAVGEMTSPESVIVSMQHSGSVNYYGGRRTLRYDWLEPARFDDAVRWLRERRRDVYILLEEWEVEGFRRRFAGTQYGGLSEGTLIFDQQVGTRVMLFTTRAGLGEWPRTVTRFLPSARRCCEPRRP